MSVQVKRRRDTAANLATFTGAQAELLVDTTNNRVQVHDGVTPGGWPAAKLSEVVTNTRTSVADADHIALASDRTIAFTSLSAARVLTLPAAASYPTGTALTIVDESGACSATNTVTLAVAGSDAIDGEASAVISSAYGYLALQSDGASKWTIVDQAVSNLPAVGIGTPADPTNPLSVYAPAALFASGSDVRVKLNKAASTNTASFLFQTSWSGRAEFGLVGDDDFRVKTSPDGAAWNVSLHARKADGKVSFPQGLVHEASGAPIGNFIFTEGGDGQVSIYRCDVTHDQNPRASIVSGVASDVLTLSGATDSALFYNADMVGVSYARMWNTTKNQSAWIKGIPASNQIQVTAAADISTWSVSDAVQIGDPPSMHGGLNVIAIDISPMLMSIVGAVFPQSGILCKFSLTGVLAQIGLTGTATTGSFVVGTCDTAGDNNAGILLIPCGDLSPISNSNLVYIRETISSPNLIGLGILSSLAVFG